MTIKEKPIKRSSFILLLLALILLFVVGCWAPTPSKTEIPAAFQTQEGAPETTETDEDTDLTEEIEELQGMEQDAELPSSSAFSGQLTVHFIDVGQGDAIFIQTPEQNILIDGGTRAAGSSVVNYIKKQGIEKLDMVVSTHPHEDHIGGLISVLQAFPVAEIIDPAVAHTTKTFEEYLTLIDQKDIKFTEGRAGMSRDLGGGAKMEILHPSSPSSSHLNDASVVVKLTFGQVSLMFTGDAEQDSEGQILLRSQVQPTSAILKVGHHGSRTSTTQAFLDAVDPEVAVILCGKDNNYGHPHEETLQKLAAAGVDIYRTDLHGTIVVQTDGQTYDINVKQPYQYTPQKVPEEPAKAEQTVEQKPDSQPASSTGQYVGSIKSDKYHKPSCRHAKNIKPENEIWFGTIEEAKTKGYSPCGVCKPPGGKKNYN